MKQGILKGDEERFKEWKNGSLRLAIRSRRERETQPDQPSHVRYGS